VTVHRDFDNIRQTALPAPAEFGGPKGALRAETCSFCPHEYFAAQYDISQHRPNELRETARVSTAAAGQVVLPYLSPGTAFGDIDADKTIGGGDRA
jgi:hypothetical protein